MLEGRKRCATESITTLFLRKLTIWPYTYRQTFENVDRKAELYL